MPALPLSSLAPLITAAASPVKVSVLPPWSTRMSPSPTGNWPPPLSWALPPAAMGSTRPAYTLTLPCTACTSLRRMEAAILGLAAAPPLSATPTVVTAAPESASVVLLKASRLRSKAVLPPMMLTATASPTAAPWVAIAPATVMA